jgi:hypothetical protein
MLKVPLTSEVVGRRRHNTRHMSIANRLRVKCLQIVNDYNDPMTMYSV